MLARRASHKSLLLHQGTWEKSAEGCVEVRNKTLGIVGYGHIGPQVGILAEAFGMRVVFYDILGKLPLGNAVQLSSLDAVLEVSDFVTLHVPETPQTINLIGAPQLARMKPGSVLLNLSRGTVVDLKALREALERKHLAGAAIDVFPEEPHANVGPFDCGLRGVDNVILTPHIGGSTAEAQRNIGIEAASALLKYLELGSSTGAVNFPAVELPVVKNSHRVLNIHRNVPGVLSKINKIVADTGANIQAQFLATQHNIGYLIMDVEQALSGAVKQEIDKLSESIRTRLLF
jgi:D-3-phosphoglycerate dehydrogenase